jgi:hypothetical protein
MSTSSGHPEIGPELRALAQAILDRLDPAVRAAAAMAAETLRGPGRCQQVWCPVCALAALASGEQHPMLTAIAEHSVTLMAMVRAMVADPQPEPSGNEEAPQSAPADAPGAPADAPDVPAGDAGRYQSIPIVIETETMTGEGVAVHSGDD